VWSDWGGGNSAFPSTLAAGIRDRGSVPMINWQPVLTADRNSRLYSFQNIANGLHDQYIRDWATAARDHGRRIFLRFAHEMDGYWFPWSANRFGNTPSAFIAAWQHIWRIFKDPVVGVGARNVKFIWSPNNPCGSCVPYSQLYPGKGYVDFVGFTSFNWGMPYYWRSMTTTLLTGMRALKAVTKKPVIITEMGTSADGGDKAAWIRDGYPASYAKWPRIKAIVYFHVDSKTLAGQEDWRLTTPPGAMDAYRELLTRFEFQKVFS
jgi:beta-mannanase